MEVRVVENQVEKAIRQLKRKIATEGVMKDLKRNRFYMKPSVRKKLKQKEAEKRRQKAKRNRRY